MLAVALPREPSPANRPASVEQCYEVYRDEIYRLGLRYGCGRPAFAEDLTHDVFLKLLQSQPDLDAVENLGAWLHTAAANLAISRLRSEQSLLARMGRVFLGQEDRVAESPDAGLELEEAAASAVALLRDLPARERVVVSLKLLEDKSQREIARELSMSEGYVSKLLTRARRLIEAKASEVDHVPLG